MSTRLTLENQYHKVSIEVEEDDLNMQDFWEKLLNPLLLGAGYHEHTINSFFDGEDAI